MRYLTFLSYDSEEPLYIHYDAIMAMQAKLGVIYDEANGVSISVKGSMLIVEGGFRCWVQTPPDEVMQMMRDTEVEEDRATLEATRDALQPYRDAIASNYAAQEGVSDQTGSLDGTFEWSEGRLTRRRPRP